MAEILDGQGVKTIAFYLPQFHAIPENDRAWGEGFTEWTNLRRAAPLFPGHDQPRKPLNGNYYNLLEDAPRRWQAGLAREYGVFGLCYYHYWFKDGRMLLEKPAERMLQDPETDVPFCFSWANENWSKRWDGGAQELIVEQDYGGPAEWLVHLRYLLPFFRDERYITLGGRPVFLIYKPEEMPRLQEMLACWQEEIRREGFPGLCLMIQNPAWYFQPSYDDAGFDYQVRFEPFFALGAKGRDMDRMHRIRRIYGILKKMRLHRAADRAYQALRQRRHRHDGQQQVRLDYDEMWRQILRTPDEPGMIPGAFVDWDNTPRKKNGYMHLGASPEKFGQYMTQLLRKTARGPQPPVVFLNAWNEWCEGAYLEPDERHGFAYLEQLRRAQETAREEGKQP